MRNLFMTSLLCLLPSTSAAQKPLSPLILREPAFASWTGDSAAAAISPGAIRMPASSDRVRNALLGGAIGAAAGAIVCTVISNIADDAAVDRFTTCTWKGYLLTGSIGFGAGFLAGWLGTS